MNKYFKDSIIFFKKTSERLLQIPNDADDIIYFLSFALGIERVLKGILYDINPIYVLRDQTFKDSAHIIYSDKFIKEHKKSNEINIKAKGEVISFRSALNKARHFSQSAFKHSSLLFTISNYRDIIAHCELEKLDILKIREILNKDFVIILSSFSEELKLKELVNCIDSESYSNLKEKSNKTIEEIRLEETIYNNLLKHKNIWESRRLNPEEQAKAEEKTFKLIDTNYEKFSFEGVECPACKNTAVVTFENEFEEIAENVHEGYAFVTDLHCYFCELEIDDPVVLDHLEIEQSIIWEDDDYEND